MAALRLIIYHYLKSEFTKTSETKGHFNKMLTTRWPTIHVSVATRCQCQCGGLERNKFEQVTATRCHWQGVLCPMSIGDGAGVPWKGVGDQDQGVSMSGRREGAGQSQGTLHFEVQCIMVMVTFDPSLWTDRYTPVKILPLCNFVANESWKKSHNKPILA